MVFYSTASGGGRSPIDQFQEVNQRGFPCDSSYVSVSSSLFVSSSFYELLGDPRQRVLSYQKGKPNEPSNLLQNSIDPYLTTHISSWRLWFQ